MDLAIQTWRAIDLPSLQATIDAAAQTIATTQETSMVERKELATRTKDFRKLPDADKLEQFKSLLKLYQGGIDTLTNRAKAAESAVLDAWKQLGDAPDPVPLLQAGVDSAVGAERLEEVQAENAALRRQLDERNDYDEVKRRLRVAEEAIESKAAAVRRQLSAELEEKENNWTKKEEELQRQLKEARDALKEAAVDRKVAARLDGVSDNDNTAGRLAELDLVTTDLARANERLAQLEQRNADLRKESVAGSDLAQEVKRVQQDNDELVRRIDRQQQEHRSALAKLQLELDRARSEVQAQQQTISDLRTRLDRTKDYEEIRRELDLLRKIEFSIDDEGDDEVDASLEKLLATRNRKLDDELVHLRVAMSELKEKHTDLRTEYDLAKEELAIQTKLVGKLEEDLSRMNAGGSSYAPSIAPSRYTSRTRRTRVSPTSSIVGTLREVETAESSVLPIITQQRDRFRQKNGELEEELRRQLTTATQLRAEVQSLKRDNAQLYERSRYVKASSPSYQDDPFETYRAAYESNMNPFQRFRQRESARAMRGMNVLEKTLLNIVRHTLSNKVTRTAFGLYFVLLHVVLVVMAVNLAGVRPTGVRPRFTGSHDDFD